jgi:hypothetical protein
MHLGVREGAASNGRRSKSTRRQMEKLPAAKVHDNAPGRCTSISAKQQNGETTFAKSAEGGNDRS